MSKKFAAQIPHTRPTPPEVFFGRREFVAGALAGAASIALEGGLLAQAETDDEARILQPALERPDVFPAKRNEDFKLPNGIDHDLTLRFDAATHNNYYEFLPGGGGPAWKFAEKFEVEPWKVEVGGLCRKPQTFDLDDIFAFPHEERLYHFRCVERWAMNIPWSGFPLKSLLDKVEPTSEARFVRFVTVNRPAQMPGIKEAHWYPWPYHEGLRIDEAMNELAFLVTGVYGEPLLKQHGAPIRLAVPWKYGYKSPKSIVQIELTAEQPPIFWEVQKHEYGFLSNVNPNIPHPRWSQSNSYWLGSEETFRTALFNGYEEYVGALYPDEPLTAQRPLRPGQVAR